MLDFRPPSPSPPCRLGHFVALVEQLEDRSADATADCRTLTMLAVWMIGNVNWRE